MIQVTDKIRISRLDDRNVIIETLDTVVNRKTKEESQKWNLKGYYGNVRVALGSILKNDMLIDHEELHSLKDYQEALEKRVNRLNEMDEEYQQYLESEIKGLEKELEKYKKG